MIVTWIGKVLGCSILDSLYKGILGCVVHTLIRNSTVKSQLEEYTMVVVKHRVHINLGRWQSRVSNMFRIRIRFRIRVSDRYRFRIRVRNRPRFRISVRIRIGFRSKSRVRSWRRFRIRVRSRRRFRIRVRVS